MIQTSFSSKRSFYWNSTFEFQILIQFESSKYFSIRISFFQKETLMVFFFHLLIILTNFDRIWPFSPFWNQIFTLFDYFRYFKPRLTILIGSDFFFHCRSFLAIINEFWQFRPNLTLLTVCPIFANRYQFVPILNHLWLLRLFKTTFVQFWSFYLFWPISTDLDFFHYL